MLHLTWVLIWLSQRSWISSVGIFFEPQPSISISFSLALFTSNFVCSACSVCNKFIKWIISRLLLLLLLWLLLLFPFIKLNLTHKSNCEFAYGSIEANEVLSMWNREWTTERGGERERKKVRNMLLSLPINGLFIML